jgi:hypothetical protein
VVGGPRRSARRHAGRSARSFARAPLLDRSGRDGTTLLFGRTYAGRYLLVVLLADGGDAFVVTARDMTESEKKTFRRKAR